MLATGMTIYSLHVGNWAEGGGGTEPRVTISIDCVKTTCRTNGTDCVKDASMRSPVPARIFETCAAFIFAAYLTAIIIAESTPITRVYYVLAATTLATSLTCAGSLLAFYEMCYVRRSDGLRIVVMFPIISCAIFAMLIHACVCFMWPKAAEAEGDEDRPYRAMVESTVL